MCLSSYTLYTSLDQTDERMNLACAIHKRNEIKDSTALCIKYLVLLIVFVQYTQAGISVSQNVTALPHT